ncbi:MAG: hypothetical protein NT062_24380, partial [Proteobacteria bacterium]|nr:hypothetical protein [Pseudomonadota bacterium]
DVSDDVGENLIGGGQDEFSSPDVPFQPKPTSVSVSLDSLGGGSVSVSNEFASDSNFTTMPKVERVDIHGENTVILEAGRGRTTPKPPPPPQERRTGRTQPPPLAPRTAQRPAVVVEYDEELHGAPTMIIDIGRMRRR